MSTTTLDERAEQAREGADFDAETTTQQAVEEAVEKGGQVTFMPKPELTLLRTVADGHDPEEYHVSFGGTVKFSAHSEKATAFVNGCKPGRRQRIVVDTFVTKGGIPQVKENADGDITHTLGIALKVEHIDLDTDPWDATELTMLRQYAVGIVSAHRRGVAFDARLESLGEFLEGKGVALDLDDDDEDEDEDELAAVPDAEAEAAPEHQCESCGNPASECRYSPEDGALWFCGDCAEALATEAD